MSKSKNSKYFLEDNTEEGVSFSQYREERKFKRRQKRLQAAIKTKNISKLMEYENDE